jgi:hypothetical protein
MSTLTDLDAWRRLAVPGSRWLRVHADGTEAEATVTGWADGTNDETGMPQVWLSFRSVYWTGAPWAPQPHAVRNDAVCFSPGQVTFDGGRARERSLYPDRRVSHTWTYLGPGCGTVDLGAAQDRSAVGPVPVDRLAPGDVVYGPWEVWRRGWSGPQPGYTVDHVDLSGPLALVTTREGWPLWLSPDALVAVATNERRPLPARADTTVYLTVNTVSWLWRDELADVPMCISRNRLAGYRSTPKPARVPALLLDSGGFTELKDHGRWRLTPEQFLTEVRTHLAHIDGGQPIAVVQQDMMCEPVVIYGGKTKDGVFVGTRQYIDPDEAMSYDDLVHEHQRRSTENLVTLRRLAPDLHIVPVLQGFTRLQYARHAGMLEMAGIRLADEPLVGLGSVCRRQGTAEIDEIVRYFDTLGLRLHGFGVGIDGLALYGRRLASTDSNAWSFNGRRDVGLCPHGVVKHEANCPINARAWWTRARARLAGAPRTRTRRRSTGPAYGEQLELIPRGEPAVVTPTADPWAFLIP